MRWLVSLSIAFCALIGVAAYIPVASGQSGGEAAPIYGIKIPAGYRDWPLIAVTRK